MRTINAKKKIYELHFPRKASSIPLKRSMSGYETEHFVLGEDGSLDHSDTLLKLSKKAGLDTHRECAKSMIETICMPRRRLSKTFLGLLDNLIGLNEIASDKGKHLYPFATYPGINTPEFRRKRIYTIQKKILGEDKFSNAGVCCGFHQHYTLPRGMFDRKEKFLNYGTSSKVSRTLVDSYNMIIAMDPALSVFLQSSPYVNGSYLAKDSRMLLYRGGGKIGCMKGLYAKHQFFGGLPPYKQTLFDLISSIKRKHTKWKNLVEGCGINYETINPKGDQLRFVWNPVKINPHGTLEYRGGDINQTSVVLGVSTMIKFILRKIQQDFLLVTPSDIAVEDAFRIEGGTVFIPPHLRVRKELQKASAHRGLEDDDLYKYARSLYSFARKVTFKEYRPLLKPVKDMLDERKTMSDRIIKRVRKEGYSDKIPEEISRTLALEFSKNIGKDLDQTRRCIEKIV